MNTYFIRHTNSLNITEATRQKLWNEKLIAVHFPHDKNGRLLDADNVSVKPSDYIPSGRTALLLFTEIAAQGAYICADYSSNRGCCLVGKVEPDSVISITEGAWGDTSRKAFLKTIALSEFKVIPHAEMIGVYARRPRQGTIRRWPKAAKDIKMLVEGTRLSASENLHSSRQESLCAEFLRLPEANELGLPILKFLLLLGRNLKAIDVYGIAETGRKIFAQVTNYTLTDSEMTSKIEALKLYKGTDADLILFCTADKYTYENGLHIVPLQMVIKAFDQPGLRRLALTAS